MSINEQPRTVRIDTAPATTPNPVMPPPVPVRPLTDQQLDDRPMASTTTKSSRTRFEPDALVAGVAGLAWAMLGLVVIIRCGFSGPMADPVVDTFGFSHTASLGLIEIGIGLALLFSAIARSRSAEITFGLALGVAGFLGVVQNSSFTTSLALETSLAWLAIISGAVVAVGSLLMPRFASQHNSVEEHRSATA